MTQRASQSPSSAAQSEKAFEKAPRERIHGQPLSLHVYSSPTKLASSANWVNGETFAFVGSRHFCDFPPNEKTAVVIKAALLATSFPLHSLSNCKLNSNSKDLII